jgi:hypothetical protein
MKNFISVAALSALAINGASAHYIFQKLTAGSSQFDTYQFSTLAPQTMAISIIT